MDDVTRKRPSVELALRLFCCSLEEQVKAREAFIRGSSLLDYNLLLLHEDPTDRPSPLLGHSLKLDDHIAEFLLGSDKWAIALGMSAIIKSALPILSAIAELAGCANKVTNHPP